MAAPPAVLWWRFSLPGMGTHLLRVSNIGQSGQEVLLDGAPMDAPAGTVTFTGPGAALLELQQTEGAWTLLADGAAAERYEPDAASTEPLPVVWFKFLLPGMGTHHLRVKNISLPEQEILLDGTPLDAPEGTMAFTGPGGTLLELQKRDGIWVLLADGVVNHQCNPNAEVEGQSLVFDFVLAITGQHQVRITNIGMPAQEVFIDCIKIPAPRGQVAFTGPGGSLLELKKTDNSWTLLVDGSPVEPTNCDDVGGTTEALWTFFGPSTGMAHVMRAINLRKKGQQVYIDGSLIPGPEGQTAFTGPGGVLLELKHRQNEWSLFVDGLCVEDHNARVSASSKEGGVARGPGAGESAAISPGAVLPQGVSFDAELGKYTANVRVRGKFKCLGEFSTPAEAHARYLQETAALGDS